MSSSPPTASIFGNAIAEHLEVVRQLNEQQDLLAAIALAMTATLRARGKILWCRRFAASGRRTGGPLSPGAQRAGLDGPHYRYFDPDLGGQRLRIRGRLFAPGGGVVRARRSTGRHLYFRQQPQCDGRPGVGPLSGDGDCSLYRRRRRQDRQLLRLPLRRTILRHGAHPGGAHSRRAYVVRLD